jgi:hypothetical protein
MSYRVYLDYDDDRDVITCVRSPKPGQFVGDARTRYSYSRMSHAAPVRLMWQTMFPDGD